MRGPIGAGGDPAEAPQVLEGVRVIDVTAGPVGGMATMILADFGADVIKVEPPGGDRFRRLPAAPLWLRAKRSVILDLDTPAGVSGLHDLASGADVLVVGGPPSRARLWGIDADRAAAVWPGLVHCSITGWGQEGPLAEVPGYEAAVSARSGRMLAFQRQLRRGGPVFAAVPVAGHAAAQGAVQGILAALIDRARGGRAQRVETSLLQGLLTYDLVELLLVEMTERHGIVAPDLSSAGGDLPTLNYHPVRAADGRWIQCGNLLEHLLYGFLDATGLLEEMVVDPRFSGPPGTWDTDTVESARRMILERVQERGADEWMESFRAHGDVAAEPFATTAEALHHPDIVANGDIVTIDDPDVGAVRTLGPIAELSATPARVGRPAPQVGEHSDQIRSEVPPGRDGPGPGPEPAERATRSARPSGRPLEGVTVVEFATIIAAPLATVLLADLGARVIKVEMTGGDPYRHLARGGTPAAKTTAGKSSICVDLKAPEGLRIARKLCRTADVVVHNARPGVADRLGLGEADLRGENPGLIWVSITGYGRHSPSAGRPATHPCAGAGSGGAAFQAGAVLGSDCRTLEEVTEVSRQLIRANDTSPDPNTSVVAASAVLMALLARERFGMGQAVHVNMLAANMYANADDAVEYAGKPPRPACDADLHGFSAGYRLYRSLEGWLLVAVTTDDEWRRCAEVIGLPELLQDSRFADAAGRARHDPELTGIIAQALASLPAEEWERRFTSAGLAGVRADAGTPGRFFAHDPQVIANGFAPEVTHSRFGTHRRWGPLVRVDGGPDAYGAGVVAGEQTEEILAELRYGPEDIQALRAAGVVASEIPSFDW